MSLRILLFDRRSLLWLLLLPALLCGWFLIPATPSGENNLLADNAWKQGAWQPQGSAGLDPGVLHRDTPALRIESDGPNDIHLSQKIRVTAGRYYRFSAWIKTLGVEGGAANLSVLGGFNRSRVSLSGDTSWTFVQQVFKAERDEAVPFALRLGYYGATAAGRAWFSTPELVELASWDGEAVIIDSGVGEVTEESAGNGEPLKRSAASLRLFLLLVVVPYLLLYIYLVRQGRLGRNGVSQPAEVLSPLWHQPRFWGLMAAALGIRLLFINDPGFTWDTEIYAMWARDMSAPGRSMLDIYPVDRGAYFIDYPPLYLYVLAFVGWLAHSFSLEQTPFMIGLVKAPAVLADLAVTALLLAYCRRRFGGELSWLLALLFAFNPVVLFDSAFWGQTDVIYTGFALVALLLMEQRRVVVAGMVLAASFALKPHTAIFILFYIVFLVRHTPWRLWLWSGLASLGTFILLVLPFAYNRPPLWILDLYRGAGARYDYFTVNAFNVWGMFGLNWVKPEGSFLGVEAGVWAMLIPALVTGGVIWALVTGRLAGGGADVAMEGESEDKKRENTLFPAFWLLALLFFVFFPRMHERYLFPALLFMLPLLPWGRRFQWSYLALTLLLFFNLLWIFYRYSFVDPLPPGNPWFMAPASAGVVALFLLGVGWLWRGRNDPADRGRAALRRIRQWPLPSLRPPLLSPETAPFRMGRFDYAGLSLLSLGLFGLLLFRIGDLNYPTQPYVVPPGGAEIEVRFESPLSLARIDIYDGIKEGSLSLAYDDGPGRRPLREARERPVALDAFYKVTEIKELPPGKTDALRLQLEGAGAEILEMGFYDSAGKPVPPTRVFETGRAGMEAAGHPLFDESHTLPEGRSAGYLRNSYFDEIYHGRTALEFVRDLPPYENTHPPLGKILIGLGIRWFDMTPLGWRFTGALFGASMVWLLFLGGRLLTGRRIGAYSAALLMMFEFMNFGLSRYATIDLILTFFITATLLSLYRWYSLGEGRMVKGSVRWFMVAGACCGMAIATKWSALYVGLGIFLFVLALTVREWRGAAFERFARDHLLHFGGIAFFAFVLIPLGIYLLSYLEFFASVPGSPPLFSLAGLGELLQYQQDMFSYHSNQSADGHPFAAPFYSWPLLAKPLWLFVESGLDAPLRSRITLLGNPAIAWPGLVLMAALLWRLLGRADRVAVFLASAYLVQLLPWTLVERSTFIYHYFPMMPLLILAIAGFLARLDYAKRGVRVGVSLYFCLVIGLFILFYPALSGLTVTEGYAASLHWFGDWGVL